MALGRNGIRFGLAVYWVALLAGGAALNSAGQLPQPAATCSTFAVINSATALDEAGRHDEAAQVLTGRSTVTTADASKGITAVTQDELDCISDMLRVIGQVSLADRIVDGVDDVVRDVSRLGGTDTINDAQPETSVGIGDRTRSAVLALVWLLPLIGLLYTVRELLVIRRDRQPGPVEVKPVTSAASQKDLPTTLFQARLVAYLADVELAPPALTVGGIGELIIPVVEATESSDNSNLKAIGKLVRRLLAPEQGSEVEAVLGKRDSGWVATVQVRTRRGGNVQSIDRLSAASCEALAGQVAARVHTAIFGSDPIKRRTPGWSRWSDPDNLAKYITALPAPDLKDLVSLSKAEPSNLNLRLQLANAHWKLAEGAISRARQQAPEEPAPETEQEIEQEGGQGASEASNVGWGEVASKHLQADTAASLTAVRLAGRLVEPWLYLAVSLTQSDKWGSDRAETVAGLRRWMEDDGRFLGLLADEGPQNAKPNTKVTWENGWMQHVAATILTRAAERTLLIPIWWRWWHPQLRSSIPSSALVPFNRRRVRTILMLKSIRQYALLRRKVLTGSNKGLWLPRLVLWTIRARLALHPRSNPQIAVRYNLALCYGWLGLLHQRKIDASGGEGAVKPWVRGAFRNQLFGAHFRTSDVTAESDLVGLIHEPDFHHEPAKTWMTEWLTDMGLPADPEPQKDPAWTVLHKTAQAKAEEWEKRLHDALGQPTGGPAGLLATRALHDSVERESAALKKIKKWIVAGIEREPRPGWALSDHTRPLPPVDRGDEQLTADHQGLLEELLKLETDEIETAADTGQPLGADRLIALTRRRFQTWVALVAELEQRGSAAGTADLPESGDPGLSPTHGSEAEASVSPPFPESERQGGVRIVIRRFWAAVRLRDLDAKEFWGL